MCRKGQFLTSEEFDDLLESLWFTTCGTGICDLVTHRWACRRGRFDPLDKTLEILKRKREHWDRITARVPGQAVSYARMLARHANSGRWSEVKKWCLIDDIFSTFGYEAAKAGADKFGLHSWVPPIIDP